MKRFVTLFNSTLLLGGILFLCFSTMGCGNTAGSSTSPGTVQAAAHRESPRGKFLICLLDETASYAGEPDLWKESLERAAKAVSELRQGDAFLALSITDKGWRSEDIRIPYTTLNATTLLVMREKDELQKRIRALEVRPNRSGYLVNGKPIGKPAGTDLLGGIDYAAFLAKDAGNKAVSVVLFTDMEDEALKSSAGKQLQTLPRFTHVTAFNVRSGRTGGADATQARIERWIQTINSMKHPASESVIEPEDIHVMGQTGAVKSVFAWMRR